MAEASGAHDVKGKLVMHADPALSGRSAIHAARAFEKPGVAEQLKPEPMSRPDAARAKFNAAGLE